MTVTGDHIVCQCVTCNRSVLHGIQPMSGGWKCPDCARVWSPMFNGPCTCSDPAVKLGESLMYGGGT